MEETHSKSPAAENKNLKKSFNSMNVWAIALGSIIGFGCFILPPDFLEKSGPYFFASADKDQPRVRPIGIFLKYNNRIYFHIGKQKDSYRQILVNPNVELVSISKEKDGGWIRITGRAVPDNGEELDKAVFEKAPGLKNMYNEETGFSLGHFYIMNGTAEISGADGTVTRFEF